jgi:hypothetical protein
VGEWRAEFGAWTRFLSKTKLPALPSFSFIRFCLGLGLELGRVGLCISEKDGQAALTLVSGYRSLLCTAARWCR